MTSMQDTITDVLAAHSRADWSDRTYACAGCRRRADEVPVPPNETPEQMRERHDRYNDVVYPGWSFADYNAHVAEHLIAALTAAGYERRPEHVHSWMTEFGHTQVCSVCRERREPPRMSAEDAAGARAYFEELRKQVEG